jgi:MinD superfamily P-loop ATPase
MGGMTMKYVITEECCGCGSCAPFCELEGIEYLDGEYEINQELCTGCGTCLEYCPIDGAIVEMKES